MSRDEDEKAIEEMRSKFGRMVQAFEKKYGISSYLNRAPNIHQPEKLKNAEVLVSRYEMLKKLPKNARVAEVGVDKGAFSLEIIENCCPNELFLIDIDLSRLDENMKRKINSYNNVSFIEGRSEEVLRSLNVLFDWIYIDGDHSYSQVKKDIDAASELIKDHGLLIFNDYTLWSPANMMNYGVSRAVNEFLNDNVGWEVVYLALQGAGYHDFALQKTA